MKTVGRLKHPWAIAVVIALLLAACGSGTDTTETVDTAAPASQTASDGAAADGTAFPNFEASTVSGPQLDFGSLEGQDTVVWFWAPW